MKRILPHRQMTRWRSPACACWSNLQNAEREWQERAWSEARDTSERIGLSRSTALERARETGRIFVDPDQPDDRPPRPSHILFSDLHGVRSRSAHGSRPAILAVTLAEDSRPVSGSPLRSAVFRPDTQICLPIVTGWGKVTGKQRGRAGRETLVRPTGIVGADPERIWSWSLAGWWFLDQGEPATAAAVAAVAAVCSATGTPHRRWRAIDGDRAPRERSSRSLRSLGGSTGCHPGLALGLTSELPRAETTSGTPQRRPATSDGRRRTGDEQPAAASGSSRVYLIDADVLDAGREDGRSCWTSGRASAHPPPPDSTEPPKRCKRGERERQGGRDRAAQTHRLCRYLLNALGRRWGRSVPLCPDERGNTGAAATAASVSASSISFTDERILETNGHGRSETRAQQPASRFASPRRRFRFHARFAIRSVGGATNSTKELAGILCATSEYRFSSRDQRSEESRSDRVGGRTASSYRWSARISAET